MEIILGKKVSKCTIFKFKRLKKRGKVEKIHELFLIRSYTFKKKKKNSHSHLIVIFLIDENQGRVKKLDGVRNF